MTLYIIGIITGIIGTLLLIFSSVVIDYLLAQSSASDQGNNDILLQLKTLKDTALTILIILSIVVVALQTLTLYCIYREN